MNVKDTRSTDIGGSNARYPTHSDFARINAAALGCLDRIVQHFVPGGKLNGREYLPLNPRRADSRPGSFSINLDTGKWADFAEDASGGDAVSLVSYLLGAAHQSDGLRALAEFLAMPAVEGDLPGPGPAAPSFKLAEPKSEEPRPLMAIPPEALATKPTTHPSLGQWHTQTWEYRDKNGELLFEIHRFDPPWADRKIFIPLTYWPDGVWRWEGCPAPRPLYGLDRLAARPQAPVLLAEGEKAADAAARLSPDHVCITTPNGAASPDKADFSPLAGRKVRIWADNDEPGAKYAQTCARLALEAGAAAIELLDLSALAINPLTGEACELPKGFDAANMSALGWTVDSLAARLNWKPARLNTEPRQVAELAGADEESQGEMNSVRKLPRGYEIIEHGDTSGREPGVYFFQVKNRKEGGPNNGPHQTTERIWLSSPMRVKAEVRSHGGQDWGKLLEFADPDGVPHRIIIPRKLLAGTGEPARALVHGHGGEVSTAAEAQRLWKDYLLKSRPPARARITTKTGWHPGGTFVLPARTFGPPGHEPVMFQADGAEPPSFATAGTLQDWRDHVGAQAVGNSRLEFCFSMAFAGPLLELTGDEPGGFHLRGREFDASSSGKTTTERATISVLGPPALLRRWRATANALEGTAESFNGLLLVLDELSQLEAREGSQTIYALGNGQGKIRAERGGEPKPAKSWNLLFLSSGEISLEEHLKSADKQYRAGLGARFVEIPADAGASMGCFENLHGETNAAAFARRLQAAAAKYYGTPLVAWLEWLTAHREDVTARIAEWRPGALAQLLGNHADPSGITRRVADRFALVGMAGELAIEAGCLPWHRGAAWNAARRLFEEWVVDRGGAGNVEAARLVEHVRGFLLTNQEAHFSDYNRAKANDTHAPRTLGRCGFFIRHIGKLEDSPGLVRPAPTVIEEAEGDSLTREAINKSVFLIFPKSFREEVIGGADPREAERILTAAGILEPGKDRPQRKSRLPGYKSSQWVYRLSIDQAEEAKDEPE